MPKAKTLSDPVIQELSLIFGTHKGEEWAPRNPGATVLGLKGKPAEAVGGIIAPTTFLDKLVAAFKGKSAKGWLVEEDVVDNVDGDGDGTSDYEQLAYLVMGASSDMYSAMSISDPDARSIAITTALDNFKKNLDDVYAGGDGTAAWKAGARHSKADSEHIDAIGANADKMASHADKMAKIASDTKGHVDALSTPPAKKDGDPDEGGDDDASKAAAIAAKAASDAAAAEAAKGGHVDTNAITGEAIAAALAPTLKAALDEQAATLKAEFATALTASTDALKADYDAKIAEATAATADTAEKAAEKAQEVDVLKASVSAIVGAARRPSAPGGFMAMGRDGKVAKAAALAAGGDDTLPTITPDMAPSKAIQALLKAQTGELV